MKAFQDSQCKDSREHEIGRNIVYSSEQLKHMKTYEFPSNRDLPPCTSFFQVRKSYVLKYHLKSARIQMLNSKFSFVCFFFFFSPTTSTV